MDELTTEQLNKLLIEGESRYTEFKESGDLKDQDEILRQLTAFANRAGGTLLYGVRNDKTIEGGTIDADSAIEKILNLVRDLTSPLVEFLPLFYHGSDGDVLAIRIFKRRGAPCAVVKRKNHEIESRKYYIRTDYGVRLMDDRTLEWLFLHQEDPIIERAFRVCVQYRRNDISLSPWLYSPMLIPQFGLVQIFQSLNEKQRELLRTDESSNMMMFLAEIVPYAIIAQLSHIYNKSWKIKVKRIGDITSFASTQCILEQTNLKTLIASDQSILINKMLLDINSIFVPHNIICLPQGTLLNVEIEEKVPHSATSLILFKKEDAFEISFRISPVTWSVGTAPGHPLGYVLGGFQRVDEQLKVQEKIAQVTLNVNITANFEFPDVPSDDFIDYFDWAQQLVAEVESGWDWDKLISKLPPGILYSIERDVKDILNHLKGKS